MPAGGSLESVRSSCRLHVSIILALRRDAVFQQDRDAVQRTDCLASCEIEIGLLGQIERSMIRLEHRVQERVDLGDTSEISGDEVMTGEVTSS